MAVRDTIETIPAWKRHLPETFGSYLTVLWSPHRQVALYTWFGA